MNRRMTNPLDNIAIVLVKPKAAGNAGSAARALKNMGLGDLRIVAPRDWDANAAKVMAVHADDVLGCAGFFPTLPEALKDRTLTVGTTCRMGPYRSEVRPLRQAVPDLIHAASTNRLAIVFGPEDYGLNNEEIGQCQRLITIPSTPDYPSLNLAQAVMIVAYELRLAANTADNTAAEAPALELASASRVEQMFLRMAEALEAIGFVSPENADHIMLTIRAMLGRSGLRPRELDILSGLAHQIGWFARGGREVVEAKRAAGRRIR
jgi:tRNA/rRNA methyltransferase